MVQRRTYVGLGSNLGDRAAQLQRAVEGLARQGLSVIRASSVYESAPVGPVSRQPRFLNAVVELETGRMDPREVLRRCLQLESQLGRRREVEQGPRTIDLDLLLAGDLVGSWPDLELPHPRLTERAFVLRPLLELDGELVDPRDGAPLARYLGRVEGQELSRREDVSLAGAQT